MKIKNILILGGGDSTRFWPLGQKSLFSFQGRPIIGRIIESISQYAEQVIVVVNHEVKNYLQNNYPSVQVITQKEGINSMGTAVLSCKDIVEGGTLILNAEDVIDFSVLNEYIKILQKGSQDYIFLLRKSNEYFPGAYVKYSGELIEGFVEKPDPDKLPSDMTKLVADYFEDFDLFLRALLETKTEKDDWYERGINTYLQKHTKGSTVLYNDYWYPLKYPWHVLPMMKHFLHRTKKESIGHSTTISKNALIIGPVYIGSNVKIGDFTKIVGPTFIEDNVTVGDHTLVRESHIGNNALVGGGSEIARSYIGEKVMLHRNYVGDSILDEGVLMGSGAVTANFRFDGKAIRDSILKKLGAIIGKNAKIGVNSTLLPGVKIGKNTIIGPSELVKEDVQNNLFLFNHTLTKNKQ